jgi:hypothetical protein
MSTRSLKRQTTTRIACPYELWSRSVDPARSKARRTAYARLKRLEV